MFSEKNFSQFNHLNLLIWCALAFQAGAINAGGYLACHRFVTHTTGFATLFGTDLAQGHFSNAWSMLSVPLFFVLGAMISAFFVDRRLLKGLHPRYTQALSIIFVILVGITGLGYFGYFGNFGEPLILTRDYILLSLLSFMSGLQNALITSMSSHKTPLRTTHLTGLTTDLGIGLVRLLSRADPHHRLQEIKSNIMRSGIIFSFISGSALSAWIFLKIAYIGFLVPAVIAGTLTWLSIKSQKEIHA